MESAESSPNVLVRFYPWIALVTGVWILVQAVLIGRGLYGSFDLVETHGQAGNLTFILVIALLIGAWMGRKAGVMTSLELILSGALLVLTFAQLGLGYEGRDSSTAASLHIPNGILITGVATALTTVAFMRQSRSAQGAA